MAKSKLGITANLLAAGLFFIANMGIIPLILLAGYVLLFEEDSWLKKAAVKAVAISVVFSILYAALSLLSAGPDSLLEFMYLINNYDFNLSWFNHIMSILRTSLRFLEIAVLLICGFMALFTKSPKAGALDKMLDKYF